MPFTVDFVPLPPFYFVPLRMSCFISHSGQHCQLSSKSRLSHLHTPAVGGPQTWSVRGGDNVWGGVESPFQLGLSPGIVHKQQKVWLNVGYFRQPKVLAIMMKSVNAGHCF
jgi:hypothetical protein